MKKLISLIALLATLTALLCGCGKFECDMCGEEKSGRKHKGDLFGEEIVYCSDCKDALEDLADMFN